MGTMAISSAYPNKSMSALAERAKSGLARYCRRLETRSLAIPRLLTQRITMFAAAWLAIFGLGSLLRIGFPSSPVESLNDLMGLIIPYLLITLAPIAGYMIASASFPRGTLTAQPEIRLSLFGKWRRLSVLDAKDNTACGPAGFLASLLIGLLLNVVLRSFEFLLAMPALNHHAPEWGQILFHLMAADVVVMSFFYMVCFVLALRSVPYFPRMLLFAWGLDITAQLVIARQVGIAANLPANVAETLQHLLHGNIDKVLISAFVWLPYLILSERVNITYRQRTGA